MRTEEDLKSPQFIDDMSVLDNLLQREGIEHSYKQHAGADPKLLEIIGYYPTGKMHIKVGDLSVIRGMVSFGDYELMGKEDDDPIRFSTAEETLEEIKKRLK